MTERYKRYIAAKLQKSGFTELKSIPNTEYITAKAKNGAKVCVQCLYSEFTVDTYDIESAAEAKTAYGCAAVMVVTNSQFTAEAEAIAARKRIMLKTGISLPSANSATAETQTKEVTPHVKRANKRNYITRTLCIVIPAFVIIGVIVYANYSNKKRQEELYNSPEWQYWQERIEDSKKSLEIAESLSERLDEIETKAIEAADKIDALGDIEVDDGLFDVTLTIPADFVGDSTQEELEESAKEIGCKVKLNADGTATYTLTKKQHQDILEEYAAQINADLQAMVGSDDFPNFVSVEANDNFTEFTIRTKSTELDFQESFSVMQFYMYSGLYGIFNGVTPDNCSVVFVNDQTGEIISESNSADME